MLLLTYPKLKILLKYLARDGGDANLNELPCRFWENGRASKAVCARRAGWFGFGRLPNWSNTAEYNDRQILSQHSNGPFANLGGRDRQTERQLRAASRKWRAKASQFELDFMHST